jgi:hypothetical protein
VEVFSSRVNRVISLILNGLEEIATHHLDGQDFPRVTHRRKTKNLLFKLPFFNQLWKITGGPMRWEGYPLSRVLKALIYLKLHPRKG